MEAKKKDNKERDEVDIRLNFLQVFPSNGISVSTTEGSFLLDFYLFTPESAKGQIPADGVRIFLSATDAKKIAKVINDSIKYYKKNYGEKAKKK